MTISQMIDEGKEWMERIRLARIHLMEKDQARAHQVLQEALKLKPDHPELLALQGVLFMMQARYEKAIECLEKARQSDPELEMIDYNLAKSYRKLGKLELAEEAVRNALAMNPENFQAHVEFSCILFKTGRAKEAIDHLTEAIRINPKFLKAYLILGYLLKAASTPEDAMFWYHNAVQQMPDAHVLREELCVLYERNREFDFAYAQAEELAKRRNLSSDYLRAGNYALILGSSDAAEAAFRKARKLNPKVEHRIP